jgi:hypothetical protein
MKNGKNKDVGFRRPVVVHVRATELVKKLIR